MEETPRTPALARTRGPGCCQYGALNLRVVRQPLEERQKSMNEADDSALDEALLRQKRPTRAATLKEAREQMEALLVPGLVQGGLSEPEARVEAMNTVARFERKVGEHLLGAAVGEALKGSL